MEKQINNRHKYTKKEDDFLRKNVSKYTLKELTKRFNQKFNYQLSESAIANRKSMLGIKSGLVGGRFEKGQKAFNKRFKVG